MFKILRRLFCAHNRRYWCDERGNTLICKRCGHSWRDRT